MERRQSVDSVVRALRRVNFQGSIFGQTVAIRLGLSESDIDALELLIDTGAATAGRLSELLGLTTGAVTRVIDRLEQAGYVRRVVRPRRPPPRHRRGRPREGDDARVDDGLARAGRRGRGRPLLARAAGAHQRLPHADGRPHPDRGGAPADHDRGPDRRRAGPSEHAAPLGGLTSARLTFRSGAQDLRLRAGRVPAELYRGRFDGATPQVRVRDGRVLVQYRGIPFDWRKRTATIGAQPDDPVDDRGRRRHQPDRGRPARDRLRRLEVTGGSERIQIELGPPRGDVPIRLTGGTKTIRLERPAGVPVRLRVLGSGGVVDRRRSHGSRSGGHASSSRPAGPTARERYSLEVIGGSKSITIVERH